MYGTIAKLNVKDGQFDKLQKVMSVYDQDRVPGMLWTHVYQSDGDPNECWVVVAFDSRESYKANAGSADQHARYETMRALLTQDPQWHDGTVVHNLS